MNTSGYIQECAADCKQIKSHTNAFHNKLTQEALPHGLKQKVIIVYEKKLSKLNFTYMF